jgi:O-antigen ligase
MIAFLLTLLLPMLGVTTLMAGSRSGLLNLGVLFLLISIEGRFSAKRQLQMVIVGALIGTLAAYFLTSYHSQRLLNIIPGASIQTQGSWSTEKRVHKLEDGLAMIADHPGMGIGIGNFMWMELEYSQGADWGPPHNSYLWATAEGGIPALLLYLLLYGVTFKTLLGVERRAIDFETRMMARGLRTAFLLFFVFSFFADFWLHIFTYLLIGLVIILRRLEIQQRERLAAAPVAQPVADTSAALPAGATPA